MYEIYAVEIYSQSQICLYGWMDLALFKSRSSKLHSTGTPNSAMNLELSLERTIKMSSCYIVFV